MIPTKGMMALTVLSCLILLNPPISRADSSAVIPANAGIHNKITSRDTIIQKQLDCASSYLKNTSVDWQDVCDMPEADNQDQEGKDEVVNRQLDDVSKEFPAMQPNAEKEFPPMQPERPSAWKMFKGLFNPDPVGAPQPATTSNVKKRVHNFDTGLEIIDYQYREHSYVATNGLWFSGVKIRGPMLGEYVNYSYRPQAPSFLNNLVSSVYSLQARWADSRDLEYIGSGLVKGKHDDVDEFRGLVGKDYFLGSNLLATPYFGFGYRYLLDRGNGQFTSSGDYAYDRKSHYYYLPLGGDLAMAMPNNWEIDYNLEYDFLITGMQKSYLSDGDQGKYNNPNLDNRQDSGYGIRGSVKFIKKGKWVDLYMEPYIRYWSIDQSKIVSASLNGNPVDQYVEPNNTTIEIGSKFGVQF